MNIFLNGEICDESVKPIIEGILSTEEDIDLFINSIGGDVYDANAVIAAMGIVGVKVNTYAIGAVMSSALIIFAAGDNRLAHNMCRFMYHKITDCSSGNIKELKMAMKEFEILQKNYDNFLLNETNIPKEKLIDTGIWRFSAKEALKMGLCDSIY